MIDQLEIRRRVLLMLDNEPGFLTCCVMADTIGCTTNEVAYVCYALEATGVVKRGTADGNKLAFRVIFK